MQRTLVETRSGRLRLTAKDSESADRALEVARDAIESGRVAIGWVPWGEKRAYLKATPLRGNAALRHTLRMAILRLPAPREREFRNLRWLAKHGIRAVTPLAAGVLCRHGWARYQFLLTEELLGARPLDAFLLQASPKERAQALDALAGSIARMHWLGFIHHDLYPRNILVRTGEVHFVDAWRGGPPPQLRGPAYDIGCLMLQGAELLSIDEQRTWFETYFEERRLERKEALLLLEDSRRYRDLFRAKLLRKPNERRGRPVPQEEWRVASLAPR